jgi:hypothetical protein
VHCYTPSPGDEHRLEEGLRGPVQRRRECGTLCDINGQDYNSCINSSLFLWLC